MDTSTVDEDVENRAHTSFGFGRDHLLDESLNRSRVCKVAHHNLAASADFSDLIASLGIAFAALHVRKQDSVQRIGAGLELSVK